MILYLGPKFNFLMFYAYQPFMNKIDDLLLKEGGWHFYPYNLITPYHAKTHTHKIKALHPTKKI